jgi:hypothetical protein
MMWQINQVVPLPTTVSTRSRTDGYRDWSLSTSHSNTHCYWFGRDRSHGQLHFTLGAAVGRSAYFHATWNDRNYVQHFKCTIDQTASSDHAPAFEVSITEDRHNSEGRIGDYSGKILTYAQEVAGQVFEASFTELSDREKNAIRVAARGRRSNLFKKPSSTAPTQTSKFKVAPPLNRMGGAVGSKKYDIF